jgi:hypothetical protein
MADDELQSGLSEFVVLHTKDFGIMEKNLLNIMEVKRNDFGLFWLF